MRIVSRAGRRGSARTEPGARRPVSRLRACRWALDPIPLAVVAVLGAILAMLLPSPGEYSKSFRQGWLTRSAQRQVRTIPRKMRGRGCLTPEQYAAARLVRFAWEKAEAPEDAP